MSLDNRWLSTQTHSMIQHFHKIHQNTYVMLANIICIVISSNESKKNRKDGIKTSGMLETTNKMSFVAKLPSSVLLPNNLCWKYWL